MRAGISGSPRGVAIRYTPQIPAARKTNCSDCSTWWKSRPVIFRAAGIWGVYLIATALGLSEMPALIVAAVFSLGATIMGPAVLVFEYEPVPRGFAVPLIFLAIGLIAHERYLIAGMVAAVAFLVH